MARLLAAEVHADLAHALDHVAVAHLGAVQGQPVAGEEALKPKVGHHRGDDAVAAQPAAVGPGLRDQREDLVAVDQFALLVRHQHPIGVAVQRDAEMRSVLDHLRAEEIRHRGAAVAVDVEAIG